jgi:hypothetical protein
MAHGPAERRTLLSQCDVFAVSGSGFVCGWSRCIVVEVLCTECVEMCYRRLRVEPCHFEHVTCVRCR